jgi:hypothetical protein
MSIKPTRAAAPDEAIGRACEELLDVLDTRMNYLTSTGELARRQVAAGALMRSRNLLHGLITLAPVRADLCGLLLRNLVEAYMIGLLFLFDDELPDALRSEHIRHRNLVIERNGLAPDVDLEPSDPRTGSGWSVENGFKRMSEILAARGEPTEFSDTLLYDLVYRSESTWGGHGLGLALPYVSEPEPLGLTSLPGGTLGCDLPKIGVAATWVAHLARHVYEQFGVGTTEVSELLERLAKLLEAEPGDASSA